MVADSLQVAGISLLKFQPVRPTSAARLFPASTRFLAMSIPTTSAPNGLEEPPWCHPRSRGPKPAGRRHPDRVYERFSRLAHKAAISLKSPFSHNALFGF